MMRQYYITSSDWPTLPPTTTLIFKRSGWEYGVSLSVRKVFQVKVDSKGTAKGRTQSNSP